MWHNRKYVGTKTQNCCLHMTKTQSKKHHFYCWSLSWRKSWGLKIRPKSKTSHCKIVPRTCLSWIYNTPVNSLHGLCVWSHYLYTCKYVTCITSHLFVTKYFIVLINPMLRAFSEVSKNYLSKWKWTMSINRTLIFRNWWERLKSIYKSLKIAHLV